jgi:hypothetical protein
MSLAKFDPDEPRDERGRWTTSGASGGENDPNAKTTTNLSPSAGDTVFVSGKKDWADDADKEKFIDANLDAAQKAADKLGVPVENILGLAASENTYGLKGNFVAGNNILNMHYPAPYAIGSMPSGKDGPMAVYANTADCIDSFVASYGDRVKGVTDPEQFVTILQRTHAFGVNQDGSPNPNFLSNALSAIHQVHIHLARRRI